MATNEYDFVVFRDLLIFLALFVTTALFVAIPSQEAYALKDYMSNTSEIYPNLQTDVRFDCTKGDIKTISKIVTQRKVGNKSWKKTVWKMSNDIDEWADGNAGKSKKDETIDCDSHGFYYSYYLKEKRVKPNTAYKFKVKVYDKEGMLLHASKTYTYWTPCKAVSSVKISGQRASWKKVKAAKGYIVTYKKTEYRGLNLFGEKVYRVKYAAGKTKSTSFRAPSGCKITQVIPYNSHSKKVYAPFVGSGKNVVEYYYGIYDSAESLRTIAAKTEAFVHDDYIYK